jgi:hypothetical protein
MGSDSFEDDGMNMAGFYVLHIVLADMVVFEQMTSSIGNLVWN